MSKGLMSIVMLNWNRRHFSIPTLETMIKKTTIEHEYIFVDNGSVDGTREYLKSMEHKTNAVNVKYVFNDFNRGVAGGRNSGLVVADPKSKYLVTIDDDVKVPDRWDILMADACNKIPKLGITGISVEPFKFPLVNINGAEVRPKKTNLGGACLCLPRRVFKIVGYYNNFGEYGQEDVCMWYRLHHLGLMSAYVKPKGIHMDKDADKAYRLEKNKVHVKGSKQISALSSYVLGMKKSNNVYVLYDPDYISKNAGAFTTDLIMKGRK